MKFIILILLFSFRVFAYTAEEIAKINKQNQKAFDEIRAGTHESQQKQKFEVEDDPVTSENIKKKGKVVEAGSDIGKTKHPFILPANEYVKDYKKYMKKKFIVFIAGDNIVAPAGNVRECAFNYLKIVGGTGFEYKNGWGQYYFESFKGIGCRRLIDIYGQDVSSITLVVKFSGLARAPQDANKKIPVFDVVGIK